METPEISKRFTRRLRPLVAMAVTTTALVAGCAIDAEPDSEAGAARVTAEPVPGRALSPNTNGLPSYAKGYEEWLRLNAAPLPRSAIPHGTDKRVYVNRSRARVSIVSRRGSPHSDGTVLLKTGARGADRASIVAIMRKVAGVDPAHGDWQYLEFERTGPAARYTVRGAGQQCWTCHAGAADMDWVFTELQPPNVPDF